jgi:hypothetical protein
MSWQAIWSTRSFRSSCVEISGRNPTLRLAEGGARSHRTSEKHPKNHMYDKGVYQDLNLIKAIGKFPILSGIHNSLQLGTNCRQ